MSTPQKLSWAWRFKAAEGPYQLRAQPLYQEPAKFAPHKLVGWKVYYSVRADRAAGVLGVRAELGGGQVDRETDDARPLVAVTWPTIDANDYTPRGLFAAFRPEVALDPADPVVAGYSNTFAGWPGCSACLPVFCEDTVRVMVRADAAMALVDWFVDLKVTLWIAREV